MGVSEARRMIFEMPIWHLKPELFMRLGFSQTHESIL